MAKWEDYVISDTGVLKNKLGINNGIKLKKGK